MFSLQVGKPGIYKHLDLTEKYQYKKSFSVFGDTERRSIQKVVAISKVTPHSSICYLDEAMFCHFMKWYIYLLGADS